MRSFIQNRNTIPFSFESVSLLAWLLALSYYQCVTINVMNADWLWPSLHIKNRATAPSNVFMPPKVTKTTTSESISVGYIAILQHFSRSGCINTKKLDSRVQEEFVGLPHIYLLPACALYPNRLWQPHHTVGDPTTYSLYVVTARLLPPPKSHYENILLYR